MGKSFTNGYSMKYEIHKKGDNIKSIILEYSLIIVFGNISPNRRIIAAIGMKIN